MHYLVRLRKKWDSIYDLYIHTYSKCEELGQVCMYVYVNVPCHRLWNAPARYLHSSSAVAALSRMPQISAHQTISYSEYFELCMYVCMYVCALYCDSRKISSHTYIHTYSRCKCIMTSSSFLSSSVRKSSGWRLSRKLLTNPLTGSSSFRSHRTYTST